MVIIHTHLQLEESIIEGFYLNLANSQSGFGLAWLVLLIRILYISKEYFTYASFLLTLIWVDIVVIIFRFCKLVEPQ